MPTEDGRLDVADVMDHIRNLADEFDVHEVAFDPRFFDLPAQMLADEGLPMVEIPQNVARMTPAVGQTFEAIKRRELTHNGDPKLTAQVLNAVARMNESGFTLAKSKSRGKIDAAVAMCIAFHRAQCRPEVTAAPELWVAYA
jgi:phage terminase large subunit-like protein